MFQGFTQGAVDFLWGIRFHNERGWFQEHKQEYLDLVDGPMRQLAVQTQQAMLGRYPKVQLELRVSRIYRDARRLHGRGPYKDHLWFVLHRPKDGGMGAVPCFYFELAPEYHSMGMGYYSATPLTMAKFRARMDRDPAPMEKLARKLKRQDRFVLEGVQYARPKGDPGALLAPWYNRKSVAITWDRNCEGSLFTPQLADEIMEGFQFLMPYYQYFDSLDADMAPEEN
jgi:uncharacterized protein (TIGR02453 family)